MSDLEKRIKELEIENEKMRLDIHALQVAIVTISTVINDGIVKVPELMSSEVESSLKFNAEFHHDEDYFHELKTQAIHLLGKK